MFYQIGILKKTNFVSKPILSLKKALKKLLDGLKRQRRTLQRRGGTRKIVCFLP